MDILGGGNRAIPEGDIAAEYAMAPGFMQKFPDLESIHVPGDIVDTSLARDQKSVEDRFERFFGHVGGEKFVLEIEMFGDFSGDEGIAFFILQRRLQSPSYALEVFLFFQEEKHGAAVDASAQGKHPFGKIQIEVIENRCHGLSERDLALIVRDVLGKKPDRFAVSLDLP
jgi:hypothetical protein